MKLYLIILLLLFSHQLVSAQNLYVLKVEGVVYADDRLLKPKEKITQDSKIRFGNNASIAHILYPGKGYFIIAPTATPSKQNEFLKSLKEVMVHSRQYYKTSSRSTYNNMALAEDIYDLMSFFRDDIAVIEECTVPVHREKFNLSETQYFYLEIAEKVHRLPVKSNNLILDPSLFSSSSQAQLFYKTQNEDVAIGTFTISFIQRKDIIDLINTFIENREGLSDQQLAREVILYFEKTYGKTTPQSKAEISTIIANINGL